MNKTVSLKSKIGWRPRTYKECAAIDVDLWANPSLFSVCQAEPFTSSTPPPPPSSSRSAICPEIQPSPECFLFRNQENIVMGEDWRMTLTCSYTGARAGGGEGASERTAPDARCGHGKKKEKRPHSRTTSQKRLASCDTGNRMAFVSFRIMSSPGLITLNETTRADANVITGETMPSFPAHIHYMSSPIKFKWWIFMTLKGGLVGGLTFSKKQNLRTSVCSFQSICFFPPNCKITQTHFKLESAVALEVSHHLCFPAECHRYKIWRISHQLYWKAMCTVSSILTFFWFRLDPGSDRAVQRLTELHVYRYLLKGAALKS